MWHKGVNGRISWSQNGLVGCLVRIKQDGLVSFCPYVEWKRVRALPIDDRYRSVQMYSFHS